MLAAKYTRSIASMAMFMAAGSISAQITPIFTPDFSGAYTGGGANQFTNVYQAEGGAYSTVSVVGNWFQMQTNHDPLINDPLSLQQGDNHSTIQLSRNRDSAALPFVNNFGIIELKWRWNNNQWTTGDQTVLGIQIGENLRNGAYNPSAGGAGPAFANISLQARGTENQFRFLGGSNFNLTKDLDGFYNLSIFAAFNNGTESVTFDSPTGSVTLASGTYSVWADGTLRLSGIAGTTTADLENIAFGFGNGTNRTFADAESVGGIYQLGDIVVSSSAIPEPSTYAALLGALAFGAVAWRRRRK